MSSHTLTAFCYSTKQQRFTQKTTERVLGHREVVVKTTHSGLCYTDVHAKEKGCGLGHEGVGHVQELGSAVTSLKVGDRVGWGWLHSSCGHCTTCLSGYRQYCSEARGFAFSDLGQGAFGDYRIIDAEFVYKIPDAITSIDAGPFMCAGASVYEALDAASTKPSDRVGVVGIGGLGHMAMLFARAMGCGVTALFASKRQPPVQKIQDAIRLGADEVRCISEGHEKIFAPDGREVASGVSEGTSPIDILLVTSNGLPDWDKVLPLLNRMAKIVLMSIQMEPLSIPYMPFILPGHQIISSTEASKRNHQEILSFAARNQIRPWVEVFPMNETGLKEAFDRLETGQMRYRGVLEW
ncbi:hypothetical protein N8I77_002317 [Diaporthe amygdali]|uniref:Enoyl reductase (ER) domain-containing protein n=1 Tax=Phomopsis amygdali TaxID=1214568 RepID=A0AAD9WB80_PHOAM|nr:hypothetical protein N8I77_002317 [Diaporthe amygdali]